MIDFFKNHPLLEGFGNHPHDHMNTTCAYFPILIYLFAKIHGSTNILEIGTDIGYSSYYLATAAKENGGMFYAIDILPNMCKRVKAMLDSQGLPNHVVCADTKKIENLDFIPTLDVAWLDGEHTTEAVSHEIELIYPILKDRGFGFIFIHDIVDQGNSDIWLKLTKDTRFESIGLEANYGLGILRKLENVRYEEKAALFGVKHL